MAGSFDITRGDYSVRLEGLMIEQPGDKVEKKENG